VAPRRRASSAGTAARRSSSRPSCAGRRFAHPLGRRMRHERQPRSRSTPSVGSSSVTADTGTLRLGAPTPRCRRLDSANPPALRDARRTPRRHRRSLHRRNRCGRITLETSNPHRRLAFVDHRGACRGFLPRGLSNTCPYSVSRSRQQQFARRANLGSSLRCGPQPRSLSPRERGGGEGKLRARLKRRHVLL